ncbi:MAG: DUF1588 domain-containing protein, partial [Gammaproteobacteria bacterium]|nr:DUF1588 domain-containing protein [Gammaproteobacteria bacterium]
MPTDEEYSAVASGDEEEIRKTIRSLMRGEGFHDFLIRGANDRLLTDAFLGPLPFDSASLTSYRFPLAANRNYIEKSTGVETPENSPSWMSEWYWGMTRAPLELIAYIVESDRNYQEVLTADYLMVNARTAELLNAGVQFEKPDHEVYKPGVNRGQILRDDRLVHEHDVNFGTQVTSYGDFVEFPQAGVLNTYAFLNRYPSTETNRNRARSRWTYYHFLGLDIEKSAPRTTDPVALADTDNPTFNNPACTVCHEVLDPVAGAFQNYGNLGYYRDAGGGLDSLPSTYKVPERFDENAEPSPYQVGDTWYRDMRTPGFENSIAPHPDNSLQWLAQIIADDSRFATAAVRFWWPALFGSEPRAVPEAAGDRLFFEHLAVFEAQNAFIEQLGEQFAEGIDEGLPFNAKDLLTTMILSPWFRAKGTSDPQSPASMISGFGVRRLLTPAELEWKTRALMGWPGRTREDHRQIDGLSTELRDIYPIDYGGIDSFSITRRATSITSLMANVAEKHALNMACPAVVLDFDRKDDDR